MIRLWLSVLMMGALLLAAPAWSADDDYRMGTGDVVHITVYGNPDLATDARVGEDGGITFPLIGALKAAGQTPSAVEKDIATRLSKGGFIVNPNVNVNIVQYRGQQISVLGRVNRQASFSLKM